MKCPPANVSTGRKQLDPKPCQRESRGHISRNSQEENWWHDNKMTRERLSCKERKDTRGTPGKWPNRRVRYCIWVGKSRPSISSSKKQLLTKTIFPVGFLRLSLQNKKCRMRSETERREGGQDCSVHKGFIEYYQYSVGWSKIWEIDHTITRFLTEGIRLLKIRYLQAISCSLSCPKAWWPTGWEDQVFHYVLISGFPFRFNIGADISLYNTNFAWMWKKFSEF